MSQRMITLLVIGLVLTANRAVAAGGTDTGAKQTIKSAVGRPAIEMKWTDPSAIRRPNLQLPREFHAGYLYIPYRGAATTNHPNSIEGLVCNDFSPSNSVFTQEAGTFFNAISIRCAIDESKITVRQSSEDVNDSANECFSNPSYCDALWIDNEDHTISFLKYQ